MDSRFLVATLNEPFGFRSLNYVNEDVDIPGLSLFLSWGKPRTWSGDVLVATLNESFGIEALTYVNEDVDTRDCDLPQP